MEPQIWPGGAELFRASRLYSRLLEKIPTMDQALQDHGALIAGGSVLNIIGGFESSDLDIYVQCKQYKSLFNVLKAISEVGIQYKASEYCKSFMRKNGIRTVQRLSEQGTTSMMRRGEAGFMVDLMAVRNRTSPLEVVQNFDLSFCQIWYDGKDVWCTHPEHIRNKHGELQGDYVAAYIVGNRFLRDRIAKYVNRGFLVDIKNTVMKSLDLSYPTADNQYLRTDSTSLSRAACNQRYTSSIPGISKETAWARKYLFRIAIGTAIEHIVERSTEKRESSYPVEDGYDSDDYVENPSKLFEIKPKEALQRIAKNVFENIHYAVKRIDNFDDFIEELKNEIKDILNIRVSYSRYSRWGTDTENENENESNSNANRGGGASKHTRRKRRSFRKRRTN